jgi:hypothetical protein
MPRHVVALNQHLQSRGIAHEYHAGIVGHVQPFVAIDCDRIYDAFALYRQLPSGVPGAYRLLGNLVSLSKNPAWN